MASEYVFDRSIGMLCMQLSKGVGNILLLTLRAKGYHIEPNEWSVVSFLKTYPNRTQQDIADFLWLNKVRVKRLIDKLESDGFVTRDSLKRDKRYNVVNLTPRGDQLYHEGFDCANETLSIAYKGFTYEEEQLFIDMLIRIKKNLAQEETVL